MDIGSIRRIVNEGLPVTNEQVLGLCAEVERLRQERLILQRERTDDRAAIDQALIRMVRLEGAARAFLDTIAHTYSDAAEGADIVARAVVRLREALAGDA